MMKKNKTKKEKLEINMIQNLTLAWIKAHVTEGNEHADQAAKEGAAGGSHMKQAQTPIPWQVAKNKIEAYTTAKWRQKWICTTLQTHKTLL